MKVQDPREFRLRFKKSKKSRDNDFNDQHFIGTQHDDITGFFGMFHGEKNDIHGFLRQNIAMAEDDQGVYEFIQNAVDAEATHFYFFYDEHNLLVINNGKKFDSNAIKSILNVGQSEGKESCDKIGKFGIGFKLIHRLVGEGSGLNEIIRDYKGPQLFSWDSLNQFQAFIHADSISQDIAVDLPWYFKIIITNFPAGVGETVKDHQYQNRIPFEESEFKEFQSFLNDVLDKMDLKALQRGSAFYLKLGKGKFQKLHQDEERLKNEVSHSLHFLGNLTTIQINDKKILKDDTLFFDKPITLQPGSEEHNALRLEEEKEQMCPVEIAYGFNRMESILASSDLKKNCTENINYYKYFPIGEEKSGFPFFIHCNVFDIGSQRRNLHKSYINEEIFNLISRIGCHE